jgi:hypothetical protein
MHLESSLKLVTRIATIVKPITLEATVTTKWEISKELFMTILLQLNLPRKTRRIQKF